VRRDPKNTEVEDKYRATRLIALDSHNVDKPITRVAHLPAFGIYSDQFVKLLVQGKMFFAALLTRFSRQ